MFDAVLGHYESLEVRERREVDWQNAIEELKRLPFVEIPLKEEERR